LASCRYGDASMAGTRSSGRLKKTVDYNKLNECGLQSSSDDAEISHLSSGTAHEVYSPLKMMSTTDAGNDLLEENATAAESDEDVSDSELTSLNEKLENVRRKQHLATRKLERDRLRAEIEKAETDLKKTHGNPKPHVVKTGKSKAMGNKGSDLLTLDKLRKSSAVSKAASKSMAKLGLELESDSSTNSGDESSTHRDFSLRTSAVNTGDHSKHGQT
jgi:hypothetical protein